MSENIDPRLSQCKARGVHGTSLLKRRKTCEYAPYSRWQRDAAFAAFWVRWSDTRGHSRPSSRDSPHLSQWQILPIDIGHFELRLSPAAELGRSSHMVAKSVRVMQVWAGVAHGLLKRGHPPCQEVLALLSQSNRAFPTFRKSPTFFHSF